MHLLCVGCYLENWGHNSEQKQIEASFSLMTRIKDKMESLCQAAKLLKASRLRHEGTILVFPRLGT